VLDLSWRDDITDTEHGVFMVAAGVPIYLHESDIKSLFSSLADGLPGAEIAFNTQSRLVKLRSNSVMWRVGMKATK